MKKTANTLKDLKVGKSAVVTAIRTTGSLKKRLVDMGLTPGVTLYVRKVAPLGDPIQISLRGYELLIRGSDAENILIQPA